MELSYRFDGDIWNYEVEYEDVVDALVEIFARVYEITVEKARQLYDDDWIKYEDLKEQYQEELKDYFSADAYREYNEARYE